METDTLYLAAVCAVVPGLGRVCVRRLLHKFGSARRIFNADYAALSASRQCTERQALNFTANRDPSLPLRIRYFCEHSGTRLLPFYDAAYPQALLQCSDAPLVLYVQGELPEDCCFFAVIGSRGCSSYGAKAAAYFAGSLAARGVCIVSGGARGVDTAAHKACLEAGGRTVAVLGCGLDVAYPEENKALFAQIACQGAVISEFAPGMPPITHNFPARNRIIAGLSKGVLVAEARRKSGALITANIAADENRDVYCVPGNIFEGGSIGCHDLIRTGAKLVDTPEDILEDLRLWQRGGRTQQPQEPKQAQQELFAAKAKKAQEPDAWGLPDDGRVSGFGRKIWALLGQGSLSLEELVSQSGAGLAAVSMELMELQLAGYVQEDAQSRKYSRL